MVFFNGNPHSPRLSGWRRLLEKLVPASVAYRPERHYMRGPGPKYRERHPSYDAPIEQMVPERSALRRRDQAILHGSGERVQPVASSRG
jgi:hypothetical protein